MTTPEPRRSMPRSSFAIAMKVDRGARATQTLHRYNAGLEVWRQIATSSDPAYRRPEAAAGSDNRSEGVIAAMFTPQFGAAP